jgi:D-glycero-alpha-D-manno-heptose 1-phosphate guanylyltransferase
MITKEAIVLAGGLGTRLQNMLPGIPKCIAPVKGRPFLTYVLDYLIDQKIDKVILSVGYRKDQIINYFGNNYKKMSIEYAIENELLGTGGAIKLAFTFCKQNSVFVINGDTYFTPDLREMEKMHFQATADVTIAVKEMPGTERYGRIIIDKDDRITDFMEKDAISGSGSINGGIYLINRKIFDTISEEIFSLENDVFKKSCSKLKMQAYQTDSFFLDMGIPEDYILAQTLIPAQEKNG